MWSPSLALLASALAASNLVVAAPFSGEKNKRSTVEKAGVTYNVFEHAATGARMEFVNNSGICETTPGVNQYSGYLSVGTDMNMWYVCPSKLTCPNPLSIKNAGSGSLRREITLPLRRLLPGNTPKYPFSVTATSLTRPNRFNGGPGCSSMIGLFQENGPCHFVGDATEPSLNEYSWNEYANSKSPPRHFLKICQC